jgi:demethylmenaquinone methyltransferase/2-methoxy-6-polyprenyl-1,4-benzoquinol methylase
MERGDFPQTGRGSLYPMENKHKHYPKLNLMNPSEHIRLVQEVFKTIPKRYDFLNHFLSLGQDVLWRRFTVKQACLADKNRLLDVAIGTGDLAIQAVKTNPAIQVSGLDFSPEMLWLCDRKIRARGLADKIRLIQGNGLTLPFRDNSFNALTIGFGIRNIPEKLRALQEMQRVVIPGGRILILEMGLPNSRIINFFYRLYLRHFIPWMARLFSPNPEAYYYLADSILHFAKPQEFVELMQEAGIKNCQIHSLTFGITYLFIGEK